LSRNIIHKILANHYNFNTPEAKVNNETMINLRNILKESFETLELLGEGGAAGHMSHLFEDPDLTFA